jgi:hypothetical protein
VKWVLNRHVERVFDPSRKDTKWGRRKLARPMTKGKYRGFDPDYLCKTRFNGGRARGGRNCRPKRSVIYRSI